MVEVYQDQFISVKSGKVGGIVVVQGVNGEYLRAYTKPSNPRTPAQINARFQQSQAAQAWDDLQEPERVLWNNFAATNKSRKRDIGRMIRISGIAWFIKINRVRESLGLARVTTPPADSIIPSAMRLENFNGTWSLAANLAITIEDGVGGLGGLFAATRPLSVGVGSVPRVACGR